MSLLEAVGQVESEVAGAKVVVDALVQTEEREEESLDRKLKAVDEERLQRSAPTPIPS